MSPPRSKLRAPWTSSKPCRPRKSWSFACSFSCRNPTAPSAQIRSPEQALCRSSLESFGIGSIWSGASMSLFSIGCSQVSHMSCAASPYLHSSLEHSRTAGIGKYKHIIKLSKRIQVPRITSTQPSTTGILPFSWVVSASLSRWEPIPTPGPSNK